MNMIWRPYLPEPRPAIGLGPNEPEPVPLDVLRHARDLCANFRIPPRQFRRRTGRGIIGSYRVESDIVAVDPDRADEAGLGGDDGYYIALVEELLHATGHPRRLGRPTTGVYAGAGAEAEEATVNAALRIVLAELGFPPEAFDWHTQTTARPNLDQEAAQRAADWFLRGFRPPNRLTTGCTL